MYCQVLFTLQLVLNTHVQKNVDKDGLTGIKSSLLQTGLHLLLTTLCR